MPLVLVAMGLVVAPLRVQVVAQGNATPLVRAAESVRAALSAAGQLEVQPEVLVPQVSPPDPGLAAAEELLERARHDYANLDSPASLAKLADAQALLRPLLEREAAVSLLEEALRLEGLNQLFLEKPKEAAQSFVSAYFLDSSFSPDAGQWPPEARLAYSDAIAAARRSSTGSLSVRIEPSTASVWLDGRDLGTGSTTVRDLTRGSHHLLAVCAGYKPFAGVIQIEGDGKLSSASVFLEQQRAAREAAAAALVSAWESQKESTVARQVAAVAEVDALVLVVDDSQVRRTVAWPLDETGERSGTSIPVDDPGVAGELAIRFLGRDAQSSVAPAEPWYLHWYVLAGAGALVVGGAVALAVALGHESPDRFSLYFGRDL